MQSMRVNLKYVFLMNVSGQNGRMRLANGHMDFCGCKTTFLYCIFAIIFYELRAAFATFENIAITITLFTIVSKIYFLVQITIQLDG